MNNRMNWQLELYRSLQCFIWIMFFKFLFKYEKTTHLQFSFLFSSPHTKNADLPKNKNRISSSMQQQQNSPLNQQIRPNTSIGNSLDANKRSTQMQNQRPNFRNSMLSVTDATKNIVGTSSTGTYTCESTNNHKIRINFISLLSHITIRLFIVHCVVWEMFVQSLNGKEFIRSKLKFLELLNLNIAQHTEFRRENDSRIGTWIQKTKNKLSYNWIKFSSLSSQIT